MKLELVRGIAAILVFICHLVSTNATLGQVPLIGFISNWGTESVIIFFILSGVVINITEKRNPRDTIEFIKNRILRVYPLYVIGLGLGYAVAYSLMGKALIFNEVVSNFLFLGTLQAHIATVPSANPVVWSLSFEMFFYIFYALTIGKHQSKLIIAWGLISLSSIPLYYLGINGVPGYFITMFAFSSIWLLGYYIYEYHSRFIVGSFPLALLFVALLPGVSRLSFSSEYYDVGKYLLFAIIASPVFVYCLKSNDTASNHKRYKIKVSHAVALTFCLIIGLVFMSKSLFISKVIYVGLPIIAILLCLIKPKIKLEKMTPLKDISLLMGSLSYALYVVHYPLLVLVNYYISNVFLVVIVGIVLAFGVCSFLEFKYQPFIFQLLRSNKKKVDLTSASAKKQAA